MYKIYSLILFMRAALHAQAQKIVYTSDTSAIKVAIPEQNADGQKIIATVLYEYLKNNMFKPLIAVALLALCSNPLLAENWPDGTKMDAWFSNTKKVDVTSLGTQYVITDYGVKNDSDLVQTEAIQAVIDKAAAQGGGVIVIPRGTYLTGSLFFKPNTHLHLLKDSKLKGSDRIANFKMLETRIEGETCKYFAAVINSDKNEGFTITGQGTIDGNGYNYWDEFWIRRKWNRECTNKDAQRPRLVYISNSSNVTVQDVHLINSPFWTNHIYNSDHVRFLDCYIYAPTSGMKAPSSDAIDIDKCHDILIDGCYMNVNDDAVVLKGGKGTYADTMSVNGPVERVLIQNCTYDTVHSMLTLGSESLHDRNIILRHCTSENANRVVWLKMRPDTPQHYEYVTVEGIEGKTGSFLVVRPWTQFFKPQDRKDMPKSVGHHIKIKDIKMDCQNFFDVGMSDKYDLHDFIFENININDVKNAFDKNTIPNTQVKNVRINGR